MEISGITPLLTTAASRLPPVLLQSLTPGQVLNATVVDVSARGLATLSVRGELLSAHTTLPLARGASLTLRVQSVEPAVHLRILSETAATHEVLSAGLRQALPRQSPLAQALGGLQDAANARSAGPPHVAQALRTLLAAIPDAASLPGDGLIRRAFANSGTFLEAHLGAAARGSVLPAAVQTDLKALLARLIEATGKRDDRAPGAKHPSATGGSRPDPPSAGAPPRRDAAGGSPRASVSRTSPTAGVHEEIPGQARPTPDVVSEVHERAESGLYRIETHQIRTVLDSTPGSHVWHAEIPLRAQGRIDVLAMQVEDDTPSADTAHSAAWTVHLEIDIGRLGRIFARINLAAGEITARLWAEQRTTALLMARHLDRLTAAMTNAGLRPRAVSCRAGCPPAPPRATDRVALLEVHA